MISTAATSRRAWSAGVASILVLTLVNLGGCANSVGTDPSDGSPPDSPPTADAMVPLTDLGAHTYLGFQGGLYPNGSNAMPSAHGAEGMRRAGLITPLDPDGRPSATGRVVLLSIGMSNTSQEFCGQSGYTQCAVWSFMGQAARDPAVNRQALVFINGAQGGQVTESWDSPSDANYDRVRDEGLIPRGLSERQVQVAWVKVANRQPAVSLPANGSDAYRLVELTGGVLRALEVRYPNLQQVFVSSRIYAGFATTTLNPEPYAYESGFAMKWLIEDQIAQTGPGAVAASRAGDLRFAVAPWVAWGPYLWARDPSAPRADGFAWASEDFQSDGTHPGPSGAEKVGRALLEFFKTSPLTSCWFLAGRTC